MMLKVIIYAYMNNIYSCRKIEKLLLRDIHYIWLAGNEHPDFITINRFRNRGTAALYDNLGLASYEAMEAFVEYIPL